MSTRLGARWSHLGVLAIGLSLTALVVLGFERAAYERDRARFERAVHEIDERIRNRIDTVIALLIAARSFVESTPALSRAQFERYAAALELQTHYPGILGIGYAARVAEQDAARFEQRVRSESHPHFRIFPEGPRPEYYPIVLLEPFDRRNRVAIGYDMYSDPVRRAAMARARDEGNPAATRRVTLVQEIDPQKQAGFLIYVPVYRGEPEDPAQRRAALESFVYSPFRVDDFFRGIFGAAVHPDVSFALYDGPEIRASGLMHQTNSGGAASDDPRFRAVETIRFAGTEWTLAFHSTPAFERGSSRSLGWVTGMLGVAFSVFLYLVTRSEMRARQQAERSRAALADERQRLRDLLMRMPAAIAIVNTSDMRYELSNAVNDALAGRGLTGKTIREGLPEVAAQGYLPVLERVATTGEPVTFEEAPVRLPEPDGGERTLYLNGIYQPMRDPDGTIERVLAFAFDVTDLVVARQNSEALTEELKTAVRARDDFLSVAGHELRTPLTALTLQIQGLERQVEQLAGNGSPGRLHERVAKASTQVARLDRLVSDLLDVSRISSGRLTLEREPLDLRELVEEVLERFQEQLTRAACSLTLRGSGSVEGWWDRLRIDQVITNLISNALKYGAGQPIEVTLEADRGRARLRVHDHGIGIAEHDKRRVFERFERAVPERNYGGLGLGLWITKQIVQAHGGTIALDSTPGQGTTFTVELPAGLERREGTGAPA